MFGHSSNFGGQMYPRTVNTFSIIHQNIRSLRQNFDKLVECLYAFYADKPALIFLTETWIFKDEAFEYKLPGYSLNTFCNDLQQSGGVAVYIRNDLKQYCKVDRRELFSSDMLKVTLTMNNKKVVFFCFYRLHGESAYEFMEDLENYLRPQRNSPNVVIVGDMNIDIMENSAVVRNYKSLLAEYGLMSYVNQPTRITPTKQSCLDHIFGKFDGLSVFGVSSWVRNFNITDHCMTGLKFQL